jgi:N-acetylglucosaminyldiphosphoundecaprenol N-acetyl-beta-D-mannosaminyltransferase
MDNVSHVNICGIKINNCSLREIVEAIANLIKDNQHRFVVTCNVDHVVKLMQDAEFMQVYKMASLVVADGVPLLWASNFLGTPLKERVNGTDLFEKLCEVAAEKNYKLLFLGGRPGAAIGAAEFLIKRYPNIRIVGTYAPPLGFENNKEENRKIVKMIRDSTPDLLFVGLGAPKQEKWIYRHKNDYRVPVSIGIGVSFELIAGMVKRAPIWMQRIGLEWFWRFMMEPGRLWKRYFIDDPKFFWLVLKQKLKID